AFQDFHSTTDFLLTSPGALKYGLYGYDNPALLTYLHQPDFMFTWSDASGKWNDFNRWGLFTAVPNFGFGLIHQKTLGKSVSDYRLSFGFGDKSTSFGFAYGWSSGDINYFQRRKNVTFGTLVRPNPYISIGAMGTFTKVDRKEAVIDLGVRPLGNELVTLFADYAITNKQNLKQGAWSYGTAVEALPGVRLTGRYFNTHAFTFGVQLSFGKAGVSTQAYYDKDKNHAYNTYGIRIGAYDRTIIGTKLIPEKKYIEFNLNGPIKYQRFKLFDKSNTLAGLLTAIKEAKNDPSVNGIAINTSGMMANKEMLWELREQLKEFKSAGKKIVMIIDRPNIDIYHFASIADQIVMDPTGTMTLEGYIMGRTFLKGTLAKLGIGFDEWRFFKYKSAAESFSRDKMSDADREQRQKLVDDYYKLAKSDICESRKISPERFDQLVDDVVLFLSEDALKEGLVDTLGRWETVKEIIKKWEGEEKKMVGTGALTKFRLPYDNYWGEPPRVAVIYALGACAMDEGITARKLVKDVQTVTDDSRVKAVVLRVDSPGGDALASDYIAEALKKCKEKKPVIISQGYVAASGGYWLSMYGDTIVAAPNTITGSIGVIGGWLYNKGLKDTLGMSTDFVKVGKHADLGFGFRLPFIGVGIPDRNMTDEERSKVELMIKTMYKEFVTKVASGRKKQFDDIEPIAQGRVWSGYDGKQNGLVDVLGGLEIAIQIARDRAGICPKQDVKIVEYPEKGLIDMSFLQPKLFGVSIEDDPILNYIKFRLQHNGQPMPMLPIDEMEFGQKE
ncbi:MAG: signal peptide peptidase SppA, partial [Bacteroidota bacterium]